MSLNTITFEDVLRGALAMGGLGVVGYLAVAGGAQIAPLAAGALISLLSAAVGYLFRGKVEKAPGTDVPPLQPGVR